MSTAKLNYLFNLKYPIKVRRIVKPTWSKKKYPCLGIYEWNSDKRIHIIKLDAELSNVDLSNTLAHEYIHAWQCEMGLKLNHGRVFKWWAEFLTTYGYTVAKYQ